MARSVLTIATPPAIVIPELYINPVRGNQPQFNTADTIAVIPANAYRDVEVNLYYREADDEFLKYNPKIFLLREKQKHSTWYDGNGDSRKRLGVDWSHPSNMLAPENGNMYYQGAHEVEGVSMDASVERVTEWDLVPGEFSENIVIVKPREWITTGGVIGADIPFPILVDQDGMQPTTSIRYSGRHRSPQRGLNLYFKFVIAIDNPKFDPNNKTTHPFIFGKMTTQTLHLFTKVGELTDTDSVVKDFLYTWGARTLTNKR